MKSAFFALAAAAVSVSAGNALCKRAQAVYAQCGGNGFTGSKECVAGSSCVVQSEWYSQCLPGTASSSSAAASSSSSVKTTSISVAATSSVVTAKASVTFKASTTSKATVSSTTSQASNTSKASTGYSPKSGIYPFGQTQSAIATTYGGNWPGGMCSLGDYPHTGLNGVALGKQQWFGASGCGSCVKITGSSGSVVAMVNDQCPECVDNHLDLDLSYANQVDVNWATKGIFDIQWSFVPCPVSGTLQFKNKEGTSAYYFALQVRNSVLPIDTLEVSKDNGKTWTKVDRSDYNYFTAYSGFGDVVDVRVTASTGAQVIEKGIKVSSGSIVTGTQQFSA